MKSSEIVDILGIFVPFIRTWKKKSPVPEFDYASNVTVARQARLVLGFVQLEYMWSCLEVDTVKSGT